MHMKGCIDRLILAIINCKSRTEIFWHSADTRGQISLKFDMHVDEAEEQEAKNLSILFIVEG